MWYLNTPANSLKLAFEMAEKLSQKVKMQNGLDGYYHPPGTP